MIVSAVYASRPTLSLPTWSPPNWAGGAGAGPGAAGVSGLTGGALSSGAGAGAGGAWLAFCRARAAWISEKAYTSSAPITTIYTRAWKPGGMRSPSKAITSSTRMAKAITGASFFASSSQNSLLFIDHPPSSMAQRFQVLYCQPGGCRGINSPNPGVNPALDDAQQFMLDSPPAFLYAIDTGIQLSPKELLEAQC
jgi:hypothetical protein